MSAGHGSSKMYTEEEVQQLLAASRTEAIAETERRPVPPLMRETFTPNDPVHGLISLPAIVKTVVDTDVFQRMRQIKQLGICDLVYPGATHNRFMHSIGTAYLAYELVKGLRLRQPELRISDRDVLCVTLAGLCHDLGHPCYSHMFEVFMHSVGRDLRLAAEAENCGKPLPEEMEKRIKSYETWEHEDASLMLGKLIFEELNEPLREAGLKVDDDGDDFTFILELISPPKQSLEQLLERRALSSEWSNHIRGRRLEKAWLYEIVSNWRSGIDVDKFDYFRRDALYLGIQRQFDHNRYLKGIRVINDDSGVPLLSPPDKDKDSLRDNLMELRKMLHRAAYQHRTVKKLESHMIDILRMMDKHVQITGKDGKRMSISQAAAVLDPVAYPKLTDSFIQARLSDGENIGLFQASQEYKQRVVRRKLMRCVANWDLPRPEEVGGRDVVLPKEHDVIAEIHKRYQQFSAGFKMVRVGDKDVPYPEPQEPLRSVPTSELRCEVCSFHYGMKDRDPITRVLFHSTKSDAKLSVIVDGDAKPLRRKVLLFWNPPLEQPSDSLTLQRLTLAFNQWADVHAYGSVLTNITSPTRVASPSRVRLEAPAKRPRRMLKIEASCPLADPPLGLLPVKALP
jgi:HD superfamily phosphohydrolase